MTTGYITHPECMRHEMGTGHPESPARLQAINAALRAAKLWEALDHAIAPEATREQLERAHDARYLDDLLASIPQDGYAALDPDTLINPHSWPAALRAAGAAIDAAERVIQGAWHNAFCAVRPPGHHACRARAMGFCLLNNVAIGVRHAQAAHGLERIAVIDFDVHHGNGTADVFAGDQKVLMLSFFQHPFYPYTGADQSANNLVNVPLPAGTDGALIRQVVEQVWQPRLEAFAPEMMFISAGFDAHRDDSLGQMALVEADYAWLTDWAMDQADRFAGSRLVSTLEGGYTLSALGASVAAHVRSLLRR